MVSRLYRRWIRLGGEHWTRGGGIGTFSSSTCLLSFNAQHCLLERLSKVHDRRETLSRLFLKSLQNHLINFRRNAPLSVQTTGDFGRIMQMGLSIFLIGASLNGQL